MQEIEPNREMLYFTFVCPQEKEAEVRELFHETKLGALSPESSRAKRESIGPEGVMESIEGLSVFGEAYESDIDQIIRILVERGIAGYSKLTQVFVGSFDTVIRGGGEDDT